MNFKQIEIDIKNIFNIFLIMWYFLSSNDRLCI